MKRSALAVVVGLVRIVVLSFGADALVRATWPAAFDAGGRTTGGVAVLLLSLVYVGVFATAGCSVAAALAPRRPLRHALAPGLIGLAFTGAGTVAMWDAAPVWYLAVSLLLVIPDARLGGTLRERELAGRGAAAGAARAAGRV
jgi:hypothetical protein